MPGIVGLITKDASRMRRSNSLPRMVGAVCHESCYTTGTWIDESWEYTWGGPARKNSFSDGMPLQNEDGNVTLVFSGEEFPEPRTIRHLKERGHCVEPEGPNYLVHLYEEDPHFRLA